MHDVCVSECVGRGCNYDGVHTSMCIVYVYY